MVSITCLVTGMIPQECSAISRSIEQLAFDIARFDFPEENFSSAAAAAIMPESSLFRNLKYLSTEIYDSKDPLASVQSFIVNFLRSCPMNASELLSLDLHNACHLLRQNINIIPLKYQDALHKGIRILESGKVPAFGTADAYSLTAASVCWPWEWNWFGLNKQSASIRYSKYIAFVLIVAALTLVALKNPSALNPAFEVMGKAAVLCGVI